MQRDGQVADRHCLAPHLVGFGQHLLHEGNARFHGLAGAAHVLNIHRPQPAGEFLLGHQPAELIYLAAQPEHHHMAEIHMPRVAAQGAA